MFKRAFSILLCMVFGAQAYAIDQSICEPGLKVIFHPNGSLMLCALKDNFDSNNIICKEKGSISFYADGRLQTCDLARPTKIDGQDCNEFDPISFYPDGKFETCRLTTDRKMLPVEMHVGQR